MTKLQKLIAAFGERNEIIKTLKKETDEFNKDIKQAMAESGASSVEAGDYVATYSVTKTENFDEDKLLDKLKLLGHLDVIKTVERVDMEALELALYDGKIAGSDLADCKYIKETPRLVVKLGKKKKEA